MNEFYFCNLTKKKSQLCKRYFFAVGVGVTECMC